MSAENLFDRLFRCERSARGAVLYEHREITYDELREATVRTAETLHSLGIVHGDRVAILLNDSPEFIASFVAIISLGAIAAESGTTFHLERLRRPCGHHRSAVSECSVGKL